MTYTTIRGLSDSFPFPSFSPFFVGIVLNHLFYFFYINCNYVPALPETSTMIYGVNSARQKLKYTRIVTSDFFSSIRCHVHISSITVVCDLVVHTIFNSCDQNTCVPRAL